MIYLGKTRLSSWKNSTVPLTLGVSSIYSVDFGSRNHHLKSQKNLSNTALSNVWYFRSFEEKTFVKQSLGTVLEILTKILHWSDMWLILCHTLGGRQSITYFVAKCSVVSKALIVTSSVKGIVGTILLGKA